MPVYKLINPQIDGSFNSMVSANKPIIAAYHIWKNISKHIFNITSSFIFTLQNTSDDTLSHHIVYESYVQLNKNGGSYDDNIEKFIIKNININIDNTIMINNKFDYLKESIHKSIIKWSYNKDIYKNKNISDIFLIDN
jgi:hypothetical protein